MVSIHSHLQLASTALRQKDVDLVSFYFFFSSIYSFIELFACFSLCNTNLRIRRTLISRSKSGLKNPRHNSAHSLTWHWDSGIQYIRRLKCRRFSVSENCYIHLKVRYSQFFLSFRDFLPIPPLVLLLVLRLISFLLILSFYKSVPRRLFHKSI